jgi:hypothetical protein
VSNEWTIGSEVFSSSTIELKKAGFTEVLPHMKGACCWNARMVLLIGLFCKSDFYESFSCSTSKQVVSSGQSRVHARRHDVSSRFGFFVSAFRIRLMLDQDFLSESELITLMEKNGIGTDASIPTHINNICERGFAKVTGTKNELVAIFFFFFFFFLISLGHHRVLVPSRLGIVLIHGIARIDSSLCQPTVRSEVEKFMSQIAKGEKTFRRSSYQSDQHVCGQV